MTTPTSLADIFKPDAHDDLEALEHECTRSNDLGDICARELLATWRARGTSDAEHQHRRNGIVVKHLKERHPEMRKVA